MSNSSRPRIGVACAYTPLPMIQAAGFSPYRILPLSDTADQAGQLLHDNLCPHIKRILDRAMAGGGGDLPELDGMVFINSCDAMRRLADAWHRVRPDDPVILLDLPVSPTPRAAEFWTAELQRLADWLSTLAGQALSGERIHEAVSEYNRLARQLARIKDLAANGQLHGGSARAQELINRAATEPIEEILPQLEKVSAAPDSATKAPAGLPVYLFGNVLPDPEVFELLESCGARVAGDDFCTGLRQFPHFDITPDTDLKSGNGIIPDLARAILGQPLCARTFDAAQPGALAVQTRDAAISTGARGIIGHTMKFCDPYLSRIPTFRDTFQQAGLPFLMLEGDCSLRSFGQQQTRIEAFIEMLM